MISTLLCFGGQSDEGLHVSVPCSDNDLAPFVRLELGSFRHMDEEAHTTLKVLIRQREENEVRTRWNKFDAAEFRSRLPCLVVYSELHTRRRVEQK